MRGTHDQYGFPLAGVRSQAASQAMLGARAEKEESVAVAAKKHFDDCVSVWTIRSGRLEKSNDLKRLVRKGIPDALRGKWWQELSGSRARQAAAEPGYYQSMLARAQKRIDERTAADAAAAAAAAAGDASGSSVSSSSSSTSSLLSSSGEQHESDVLIEIEKDLHRTFPEHHYYGTKDGLAMLRRVLVAYAEHNPAVGYCQSMNFVTGVILLFMEEEEAFWLLAVIVEDIVCTHIPRSALGLADADADAANGGTGTGAAGANDDDDKRGAGGTGGSGSGAASSVNATHVPFYYHQRDLAGCHIDQAVFRDLVSEKLPSLYAKLQQLQIPLEPLTINWFLSLFVNTLPFETMLHLWDCMFNEGVSVVLRAALTLLKANERLILLAQDFEQLLTFLKCKGNSSATLGRVAFLETCFDSQWLGSFSLAHIQDRRRFHAHRICTQLQRQKRASDEAAADAAVLSTPFVAATSPASPVVSSTADADADADINGTVVADENDVVDEELSALPSAVMASPPDTTATVLSSSATAPPALPPHRRSNLAVALGAHQRNVLAGVTTAPPAFIGQRHSGSTPPPIPVKGARSASSASTAASTSTQRTPEESLNGADLATTEEELLVAATAALAASPSAHSASPTERALARLRASVGGLDALTGLEAPTVVHGTSWTSERERRKSSQRLQRAESGASSHDGDGYISGSGSSDDSDSEDDVGNGERHAVSSDVVIGASTTTTAGVVPRVSLDAAAVAAVNVASSVAASPNSATIAEFSALLTRSRPIPVSPERTSVNDGASAAAAVTGTSVASEAADDGPVDAGRKSLYSFVNQFHPIHAADIDDSYYVRRSWSSNMDVASALKTSATDGDEKVKAIGEH
jgi:hypothetical protein